MQICSVVIAQVCVFYGEFKVDLKVVKSNSLVLSYLRTTLFAFQCGTTGGIHISRSSLQRQSIFRARVRSWMRLFQPMGSAGCPPGDVSQRDLSPVYLFIFARFCQSGRYQGVDRYLNFVLWSVKRCRTGSEWAERVVRTCARHSTVWANTLLYHTTAARWRSVDVKLHEILRNVACNYPASLVRQSASICGRCRGEKTVLDLVKHDTDIPVTPF